MAQDNLRRAQDAALVSRSKQRLTSGTRASGSPEGGGAGAYSRGMSELGSGGDVSSGGGVVHVALLRGINVGGRRKLPMAELGAIFADAGATGVRTNIQSGNVVFTAPACEAERISAAVSEGVAARFGFRPPVVTRTGEEWARVVGANPFLGADPDIGALHVAFLASGPEAERVARIDPDRSPGDACAVRGREVYLHLPSGVARTKLGSAYLDSTLGTVTTMRNWRTVLAVLEMVRAGP